MAPTTPAKITQEINTQKGQQILQEFEQYIEQGDIDSFVRKIIFLLNALRGSPNTPDQNCFLSLQMLGKTRPTLFQHPDIWKTLLSFLISVPSSTQLPAHLKKLNVVEVLFLGLFFFSFSFSFLIYSTSCSFKNISCC